MVSSFDGSGAGHYVHINGTQERLNIITWRIIEFMYDLNSVLR